MVGSYRQSSLAGAGSRAYLGTGALEGPRRPTKRDRAQARDEERQLLEANRVLSAGTPAMSPHRKRPKDDTGPSAQTARAAENASTLETQPLLGGDSGQIKDIDSKWEEAVLMGRIATTWQSEAKFLARASMPLIATYLLQYSLTLASIFTVGHLGTIELGVCLSLFSSS